MESTWSPGGVHMESVGEGKVHLDQIIMGAADLRSMGKTLQK